MELILCMCSYVGSNSRGTHPRHLRTPGPKGSGAQGPRLDPGIGARPETPVSGPGKQLNDEILCENIEYPGFSGWWLTYPFEKYESQLG